MSKVENGVVSVPRDYFLRMAKLDYSDYKNALAREFYQNSVDADADLIEVTFNEAEKLITVTDDGIGMDYSTIKDKLLVLGGSLKRTGDVGAFGKAKEVLYFSWEKYEVRTRDLLVKGQGAEYTIERVDDYHDGTTSKIWLWDSEKFSSFKYAFRSIARKFQVFATIKVDDDNIDCELLRGDFIRDLGWANLYVDATQTGSWHMDVRIDGQWMFNSYHGEDDIGKVVVELKKGSTECLNSNRDSLKGQYNSQLNELLKQMLVDKHAALEAQNPTVRKKYKGTGKVEVNLENFIQEVKAGLAELESKEEMLDALLDIIPADNMTPARMDRIESELKKSDFDFIDLERLAFIGYEPDFVTVYEQKDASRVERFMESRKAKVIARAWTDFLKQVLLDIGWYGSFTAGFNFEDSKAASYEKVGEDRYFYLNPDMLLKEVDEDDITWVRYHSKAARVFLREDILAKAIHEISHLDASYHNENFTNRCEWVRAQTWKSINIYPMLMDEAFKD